MKKLISLLIISISLCLTAKAQQEQIKVKKTTTATQKVHNTFSKHKHYKGYKIKHTKNGHTVKRKVNLKKGTTVIKKD
jgi:ABC-type metal ion transport system substrate-binding protein